MEDMLFVIGICVVLPIVVVWLNTRKAQNETNKRTEVLLKAIDSGANIDTELFRNQFTPAKTIKEKLLDRLTAACIVSAVGLAICIALLILAYNGGLASDLANFILISGGIILAVGISLFVVYFVGKRMLASEIETEEKTLSKKEK